MLGRLEVDDETRRAGKVLEIEVARGIEVLAAADDSDVGESAARVLPRGTAARAATSVACGGMVPARRPFRRQLIRSKSIIVRAIGAWWRLGGQRRGVWKRRC